jgi:hypothetical protein
MEETMEPRSSTEPLVLGSLLATLVAALIGCSQADDGRGGARPSSAGEAAQPSEPAPLNRKAVSHELRQAYLQRQRLIEGRNAFRYDTFGDEMFWGDQLRLHEAIAGQAHGGVGPGVSPKTALEVGLKVDSEALPREMLSAIREGTADLDAPTTTLALLQNDAVVGVTGFFDRDGSLKSLGIQCALCHSDVDDSVAEGIGRRLDGWANRDLNVGAIVSLSPDLSALTSLLGVDDATVRAVLAAWGPGKYDAALVLDGKGMRPDGETAATLIPPAFGLAGVNLHTFTGWGSIPHWNAFVAILQMHGRGNFEDPRLDDATRFPIAAKAGFGHTLVPAGEDRVAPKLAVLQLYQMSLNAPPAPADSFDAEAAQRGSELFSGQARCASCHLPPLYTESGYDLHMPADVGIDDFAANRSPTGRYRTTPLAGLWTHSKGGFYHDGRFETLLDVVDHYDALLALGLSDAQKGDLVEFLKSI